MEQGKIKWFSREKRYGFIQREGNNDVYLNLREWRGPAGSSPAEGQLVRFTLRSSPRGPQAANVFPIDSPGQRDDETVQTAGYRFINPYNFVRPLPPPILIEGAPKSQLLGRTMPPPHDRWVGLTGRITCKLTTATPLFIAGTGHIYQNDGHRKADHRTYEFFKYQFDDEKGPEHAIPASSLRGMIRSTFEAVTNSCLAHFDYGSRLSYHLAASEALKLVPARVHKSDSGTWQLQLLPGTAQITIGRRPDELYAGRVEQYEPLRTRRPRFRPGQRRTAPKSDSLVPLNGLKHGDSCWALARKLRFPPVWHVMAVAKDAQELPSPGPNEQLIHGYLCINNQNIENKRFERFFFDGIGRKARDPRSIPLPENVRSRYSDLIKDYQKRHKDTVKAWLKAGNNPSEFRKRKDHRDKVVRESAFSQFILSSHSELSGGELVYAMLSGTVRNPEIQYIVPVAIPRVSYDNSVSDLLLKHLHKCDDFDQLCPACRVFGWVYGKPGEPSDLPEKSAAAAYRGRIQFSHGKSINQIEPLNQMALAILSSPKPTTTRFYLASRKTQKPQSGQTDFEAGYDNKANMIRGRKFYYHHVAGEGPEQTAYWQAQGGEHRSSGGDSDQNRTILDPLPAGAEYAFELSFTNLAEIELGALLWSLTLNEAMHHRLGMGKPLGFGSVKIDVTRLEVVNHRDRYGLDHCGADLKSGWQNVDIDGLVRKFVEAMEFTYKQPFDQLANVSDLSCLLSAQDTNYPIHYPRSTVERDEQGKNFAWFMGNNRQQRIALPDACNPQGLPLIDKRGNIIT